VWTVSLAHVNLYINICYLHVLLHIVFMCVYLPTVTCRCQLLLLNDLALDRIGWLSFRVGIGSSVFSRIICLYVFNGCSSCYDGESELQ
jgi:hypothetical protein